MRGDRAVGWRDLLFPRDRTFGHLLAEQATQARRGADLLRRYEQARDPATAGEMTTLEAEGDALRRRLVDALQETFVTPMDREDLFALSRLLDDILDTALDALLNMAVFEVGESAHLREMTTAIAEAAAALQRAVSGLAADGREAGDAARRAKRLENEVGNLYRYGLQHALTHLPGSEGLLAREVFASLREVGAAVGRAADLIGDILVKGT
jgi:predicted phosphate transport protein (TIGR00153 family)